MESVFLITFVGESVYGGHSVIGYINSNDTAFIADYIKKRYNLTLGEQYQPISTIEIDCHWEYATNMDNLEVHVDKLLNLQAK